MRATAIPNMEILLRLVAESPSGSTYGHAEKGRHNRSPNAPPRPRTSTGEPLPAARPPEGSAGAPRPPAVSAGSVPVGARGSVPGPDPAAPPRSARPHRRPRNGAASAAMRVGPAGRGAAPRPLPPGSPRPRKAARCPGRADAGTPRGRAAASGRGAGRRGGAERPRRAPAAFLGCRERWTRPRPGTRDVSAEAHAAAPRPIKGGRARRCLRPRRPRFAIASRAPLSLRAAKTWALRELAPRWRPPCSAWPAW